MQNQGSRALLVMQAQPTAFCSGRHRTRPCSLREVNTYPVYWLQRLQALAHISSKSPVMLHCNKQT